MDLELRRDPERLLEQIEEEERRKRRGRLKIFLGHASGVGKSVKMLAEGLRRRERGEDVVVVAVQPKSSPEIDRLVAQYAVIPTLKIRNRDVIDIERILRRHPQVGVIDGLAYTNPPGSRHSERWQEIEEILNAGISVITSINLHYIRELQDEVAGITGKRPAETVPLDFLKRADDIEIVDSPRKRAFQHCGRWRYWSRPKSWKVSCAPTFIRTISKKSGERRNEFWSALLPGRMPVPS